MMNHVWNNWIFFIKDPVPGEFYSRWWNQILAWVSFGNVLLVITTVLFPALFGGGRTENRLNLSMGSGRSYWILVHRARPLLAVIYVAACAVRAVWPRMDELRFCFYDNPISVVAIGRSLATVAELCFCAQVCLATLIISDDYAVANSLMIANVVAQSCCWYSVLTQNQIGHTVEESIWLISGICWTYSALSAKKESQLSRDGRVFRRGMLICGPLYVLFMATVDVPMYYNRYARDTEVGRIYKSVWEGAVEITRCLLVTKEDTLWVPEMPWFSLYFTCAVWTSIWLGSAAIHRISLTDKELKCETKKRK